MSTETVYGVTPPMSVQLPTEHEKQLSDTLIDELRRQKTFESPSDTQKRYCFDHLQMLWVIVANEWNLVDTKYSSHCNGSVTNL